MRYKQAIQIGRNINGIFYLPCVYQICKNSETNTIDIWVYLHCLSEEAKKSGRKYSFIAHIGDWLCEDYEGKWHLLTDKEYRDGHSDK